MPKDDLEDESLLDGDEVHEDPDDKEPAPPKDEKKDDEPAEHEELDIEFEAGADPNDPSEGDGALEKEPAEGDDEKTRYSREVQERIAREQRRARDANARALAAHQARLAAEAKSRATQKEALEVTESALESQVKATEAALVKAKDDNKTEEEVKLQSALNRLASRQESLAKAKRDLEAEIEAAKRGGGNTGPNPVAEAWKRRNPWFSDPRYAEQADIVRTIDARLKNVEGYDPTSEEYFAELDRRIRRRMPELQKVQRRQQPGGERERQRQPMAPVRRSSTEGAAPRGGKIVLGKSDFATMRTFGLDPTLKEHQLEYARNKVRGGSNG